MTAPEEPGVETVIAARGGDQRALDDLVAGYLPLVYNIVGHALGGHADTDDVVQETMLRAVHGLSGLRDPASFRSWLVVIALNQVRERHRRQVPAEELVDQADPGADFVDLTILRLQLSGQRREVVAATRWLSADERELLSLWWLAAAGRLTRAEVAEATGLSPQHAAVRIQRLKAQLDSARIVVRALSQQCLALKEVLGDWDGQPSALWRKRIARHVRECPQCGRHQNGLAAVEALVAGLPLVAVPVTLGHVLTGSAKPVVAAAVAKPWYLAAVKPVAAAAAAVAVTTGVIVALPSTQDEPIPQALAAVATTTAPTTTTTTTATTTTTPPTTPVKATTVKAPPVVPARKSAKKGVSTWTFPGVTDALKDVHAGWFYTWAAGPEKVAAPPGVEFVPMIWGAKSVTPSTLAEAKKNGTTLLGFNEPDLAEQSNMTVEQALDLWPQLQSTGMRLGSPAVAFGGDKAGGWLDRFMTGAAARGLRVDFITLHWYGGDFSPAAVGQLKSYISAVQARYNKPVWLTEYSLIDFSQGQARYPTPEQLAAFATGSTAMLENQAGLERYAWFALPADKPGTGLYKDGRTPTPAGIAYRAAGPS
ncbi:sigma-70 family RNA polymerase sigma factor [Actinocrispum sp. NPDC049592]|uniref:sigma-70 family RNA polymerase sigma factor n=1 Tax=Actinocrispum sp. NPDC049592 TaxID=3154835 RepID=UPI00343BF5FD